MTSQKSERLQALLNGAVDNSKVFGTSFCVVYQGEQWCGASGNLRPSDQFFIASTTKLFVTALVLHLRAQGALQLDDVIAKYLPSEVIKGLHVLNQHDYSHEITIRQCLAHTSGIPDYFQLKQENGASLERQLMAGQDQFWSFERAITFSKSMKPRFKPGAKGKAHYADTNFQLLGKIIEIVTQKSLVQNYAEVIIEPLKLQATYLYSDINDQRPQPFYYKSNPLHVPQAMASFGADGGIVSTASELMRFLQAFFAGNFFPKAYFDELKQWNAIFFPMQSGVGIHRFKLPWFFNPFGTIPELIGHSGLSGTLAYCSVERDLYVAGTVNQVAYPSSSFRLAVSLIQKVLAK